MKKLTTIITLLMLTVVIGCAIPQPPRPQNASTTIETNTSAPPANEPAPPVNETAPEETEPPKPDFKDVPRKEVIEGDLVNFPNLKAADPDGDPITYTFTSPFDEQGTWQTKVGDAGEHLIKITASDGTNTVAQQVLIVVKAKNKAPIIGLESPVEVEEGDIVVLEPEVSDPDGDAVTVTYSGWMESDSKETTSDDGGLHKIIITASDGKESVSKEIFVSVKNINRGPELQDLSDAEIKEGEKVTIKPVATDPDGDKITFRYSDPVSETGVWQSKVGDAGTYDITVTASDGTDEVETTFTLTVIALNKAPVIELASPIASKEGDVITLEPQISDPEGDEVKVTYTGWMTSATKNIGYEDAGNHKVLITAKDSAGNEAKLEVIISVEDRNRPPIFAAGSFN